MKLFNKNIILYILIVLLPASLVAVYYSNKIFDKDAEERLEHAKWVASVHEEQWNTFISEASTTLDILSMTASTLQESPKRMGPLLNKANAADPRYGGIYLLDAEARVITGVNQALSNKNLFNTSFMKEVMSTKTAVISERQEILNSGQRVIGFAKSVLDEKQEVKFIILMYLRIDYGQNLLKALTPEDSILVTNASDDVIMNINHDHKHTTRETFYTLPIDRIPWQIHVLIQEKDKKQINRNIIQFIIYDFIIFHIIFLFLNYLMLRRQAAREKKENELQKLELVGTLAASTAHEIRNPLTGIKGLVQLLGETYQSEKDQYYFSIINKEINRINEIVSEFLILGKPTVQKMEPFDIREIFAEVQPLIEYEARLSDIQTIFTFPAEPISVHCTKDQIKQILLNITKNAIEAMDDGGKLTVILDKQNDECKLWVIDTGQGMSKKELKKIFKPFYTSKETGTGLGLVICKRILQSFSGEIEITSSHQKGTTVLITLPLFKPNEHKMQKQES